MIKAELTISDNKPTLGIVKMWRGELIDTIWLDEREIKQLTISLSDANKQIAAWRMKSLEEALSFNNERINEHRRE